METIPAEPVRFFNQKGLRTELCAAGGRRQSRRPAADNPEIIIVMRHDRLLLL